MRHALLRVFLTLVLALSISTAFGNGTFLWEDRINFGHRDRAFSVAVGGNRAFVSGAVRTPGAPADWFVNAYDIRTGAVIWIDRFDRAGQFDNAFAVAVDGGQVFVAGETAPAAGDEDDFTVRAYDARNGELLWQDIFDFGGFDEAFDVAVGSGIVVAVGGGVSAAGSEHLIVRAYDAATGALIWTLTSGGLGGDSEAAAVAIDGNRAFVAGLAGAGTGTCVGGLGPAAESAEGPYRGDCDLLVVALDLASGRLHWGDLVNIGGNFDEALSIAAQHGKVAVVGVGTPPGSACQGDFPSSGNCDWLVRVYDGGTGTFLWGDLFDRDPAPGGFDRANGVVMDAGAIFVSGFTAAPFGNCTTPTSGGDCDFTVRAYDATTGGILWEDLFDLAHGFDTAGPIAVGGGRLVVGGRGQVNNVFPTDTFFGPLMDWLIRAYDAKTGASLWQDRFDFANGHDRVSGVHIQGNFVIAVGRSANTSSGVSRDEDWLVRAYQR